ncbi:MAG: hypothetical protein DRG30_09175 [Epsilonproteobacteria bacterium]|nr:MAG: hypothetical protein DRG30_09175 [Campylobacterota bacterium]
MRILLINTNPVISRLFSWNTNDDDTIRIDEIDSLEKISEVYYDVVFLDEKCCDAKQISTYLRKMNVGEKILFSTQEESIIDEIDRVILKPFLPSEIMTVLQSALSDREEKEGALVSEKSISLTEEITNEDYSVLDGGEIEIIKQLLLEDDLEVNEERIGKDEMELDDEGIEKNYQTQEKQKSSTGFEEKLLESLFEMKPRKIRKLLGGAEVSITIKFPKEE